MVILGIRNVVTADLRLRDAHDIKVREIALTGEPDDVARTVKVEQEKEGEPEKLTPENVVFSGCSVTNGKGKGLVIVTGMCTLTGRIAQLIAGEDGDTSTSATPLQ